MAAIFHGNDALPVVNPEAAQVEEDYAPVPLVWSKHGSRPGTASVTTTEGAQVDAQLPQPAVLLDHGIVKVEGAATIHNPEPGAIQSGLTSEHIDSVLQASDQRKRQLADLQDMMSTFLRRYDRVSKLRERVLRHRSRTEHQWSSCRDYRRFVTSSQKAFIDALAAGESADKLRKLHLEVTDDYEAQTKLGKETEEMENELAGLEFQVQKKEESLAVIGDSMVQLLSELNEPSRKPSKVEDGSQFVISSGDPSSTNYPPLVEHYFDKVGDLGVARERLSDLQMEYADARTHRQLQQDQDLQIDMTDTDFDGIYRHRLNGLIEAVNEALKVAERAKQWCLDDGLDPENFMPVRRDESLEDALAADTPSNHPLTPPASSFKISEIVHITDPSTSTSLRAHSLSESKGNDPPLEYRVQNWMAEVEDDSHRPAPDNEDQRADYDLW